MGKGLDYTVQTTPEIAKAFVDAGIAFVCRYLVPVKYKWKRLTKDEAEIISRAGLNIVSVFESTASRASGGTAAGKADGITALAEAKIVGQPEGSAIYFAVDYDAKANDHKAIEEYLKAAAKELMGYHVGVYGSYSVCLTMFNLGIKYLWQTYAWSGGKFTDHANIYQYKNGQTVADVTVDLNNSFGGEGWWSTRQEETPFSDVPADHWAMKSIKKAAKSGVLAGVAPGVFGLGQNVTREQLAVILDRVGLLEKGGETDVS